MLSAQGVGPWAQTKAAQLRFFLPTTLSIKGGQKQNVGLKLSVGHKGITGPKPIGITAFAPPLSHRVAALEQLSQNAL